MIFGLSLLFNMVGAVLAILALLWLLSHLDKRVEFLNEITEKMSGTGLGIYYGARIFAIAHLLGGAI